MTMEIPLRRKYLNRPKGRYKSPQGVAGTKQKKHSRGAIPQPKPTRRRVLYIDGGTGARSWGWMPIS